MNSHFPDDRTPQPTDPQDPRAPIEALTQRARIQGQQVWFDLLRDRLEWNQSPDWAQDQAIKAVSDRLGASFRFLNTAIYECGGQRHRIAQFEHRSTTCRLNLIPGGSFEMGGAQLFTDHPLHSVRVPPILVGSTPLTQEQWDRIGGEDRRQWRDPHRPLENVSWFAAQDWLETVQDGLSLLSEAEWEYACRGGSQSKFCFGDVATELGYYAWFEWNSSGETHRVGDLEPNAFGLYDVHGNVWEWCLDAYHSPYDEAPGDGSANLGNSSDSRILRGGGMNSGMASCRCAHRHATSPQVIDPAIGLRIGRRLH